MKLTSDKRYLALEYTYIVIGSFITGFSITIFTNPSQIAPGGVSGIATILYHMFGWDLGLSMLLMNIPLFLVGVWLFGKQFGFKSVLGSVLLSVATNFWGYLLGYDGILDLSRDMNVWLSCLFGGVTAGLGIGLVMKSGSNTGGTDILAQILAKYGKISLGTSLFLVDGVIILMSAFTFGIEKAMFAIIVAYVMQIMVDKVILNMGTNYAKTVLITSEKIEEIRAFILNDLDKSGSIIDAKGMYSRADKPIIMTVIPNNMIAKLTRFVHIIDPSAFMIIQETIHVFGEGNNSMAQYVALNKDVTQQH
ncbi:MAG TPA: YitT family protein [Candidatus Ornithospirochaeta avicola]|uniref:YitT family protein n=1 Tax=Candidatus Ornithospirochaeta avicola TaxID=2840896 RepID=A0A9D1TN68_9SPIO|nr:YitT family protein [Candidatus Ornithospirochaeta avicola]